MNVADIKPITPVRTLDRSAFKDAGLFGIDDVSRVVGMSPTYIRRAVGHAGDLDGDDLLLLLDLDAFRETLVPRSMVLDHLSSRRGCTAVTESNPFDPPWELRLGNALDLLRAVPSGSVQSVVTSTPYWGLRIYSDTTDVAWADGEVAPYGHEQTPDAFVRHTVEILLELRRVLAADGSIWWNVMDTFNTRTQIRGSASEALSAMQGRDDKRWSEHRARRYSAGHAYLLDGEQCLIPQSIAERASRAGFHVKSMITWAKRASMPEPQNSRVSRNVEYVLHITKQRTPKFDRSPYLKTPPRYGGRHIDWESEKLSDVWVFNTSSGGKGHGAQFPVPLPGRCIALSTSPGDLVLDPFVGSGTTGIAALHHGCRFLGFDASPTYLAVATDRLCRLDVSA